MEFRYTGKNRPLTLILLPWRTLMQFRRSWRAVLSNVRFLVVGRGSIGTKDEVIGITVSTDYDDILREVFESNICQLDHWFIVTTRRDLATQQFLRDQQNVTVLYWNPHSKGRLFDLGTGIRVGQKAAYKAFPKSWYLRLDSDIALPQGFRTKLGSLLDLDWQAIYGAPRLEYLSLMKFRGRFGGRRYVGSDGLHGYFQLYCLPLLYRGSRDASRCDLQFKKRFFRNWVLEDVEVSHLGAGREDWQGRKADRYDLDQTNPEADRASIPRPTS